MRSVGPIDRCSYRYCPVLRIRIRSPDRALTDNEFSMNGRRIIYASIIFSVVALSYFGWKLTARGAYESAEYSVVQSDGPFEVREYEDLMMATTNMKLESQGDDGSFMRLFQYISEQTMKSKKSQ